MSACKELLDRLQPLRTELEKKLQIATNLCGAKDAEISNLKKALHEMKDEIDVMVANDTRGLVNDLQFEIEKKDQQLKAAMTSLNNLTESIYFLKETSKKDKTLVAEYKAKLSEFERKEDEGLRAAQTQTRMYQERLNEAESVARSAQAALISLKDKMAHELSEKTKLIEALKVELHATREQEQSAGKDIESRFLFQERESNSLIETLKAALAKESETVGLKEDTIKTLEAKLREVLLIVCMEITLKLICS